VGAGFAGLHMLHQLRGLGFSARVIEAASDVGGVWYWNRYPGARCDVESLQYSYSFCSDLEQSWNWTEKYAAQPEILRYIEHVASRFDLRREITFNTRVLSAIFNDRLSEWCLQTDSGLTFRSQYCVMATGALSVPRLPDLPGIENFEGPIYHTGAWPREGVDLRGKRVGVIGTGSSGIQAIPVIARQAKKVSVFQRTANFVIPAHNGPLEDEAQVAWKSNYADHRARAKEVGTLYEFSAKSALATPTAERVAEYERRWQKGGVNFVHAFNDLMIDKAANDTISDFVRHKIRQIVKNPVVADSLCPTDHPLGTKRICVDTGYFETFNRDNVELVDLKKTPVRELSGNAVVTTQKAHEIDLLVCATGYDALTGAVLNIDIQGLQGQTLKEKWAQGPRTYLGLMTQAFPNLFFITGAGSPSVLVNMIVGIEHHVAWICDALQYLKAQGFNCMEASKDAENNWVEHVNQAANKTLLPLANSWFLGANIPGKPRVFMPYVAKIGLYRKECQNIADQGYQGFKLSTSEALFLISNAVQKETL
jgi:cyclohexanone monooxygenase